MELGNCIELSDQVGLYSYMEVGLDVNDEAFFVLPIIKHKRNKARKNKKKRKEKNRELDGCLFSCSFI